MLALTLSGSREFVHFGAEHLGASVLAVAGGLALALWVRKAGTPRLDRAARWALAVACVAFEAAGIALTGVLPLHLCDISILVAPVVLLTGNRYAFELLYFWGVGGAPQALAQPPLFSGFPAPICIAFFLGHGLILASAFYATLAMRLRPTPRSVIRVWLLTNAYGLLIIPVNLALGTNFLFIMRKPQTPSLLDLMGPYPYYMLVLDALALVVFGLCYLPFWAADRRAARRVACAATAGYDATGSAPGHRDKEETR
ncbi:MAG TPA: TIGR02206 family membrane protein [Planctomycetota bacterium]|nr:TIGR02206 family membrane protein [Planctomycetota bacterium]HRR79763.1 TIGR02206 family membrane protein [Planctomycetota bacterium]HRT96834.1 TIGR02206 family membrane protein [Planctomycetota bacterium]